MTYNLEFNAATVLLAPIQHPVRLTFIILGSILAVLALVALFNYLRQRRHQQKVDAEGLVLYATVLASAPIGGLAKYVDMQKIDLRIQEPGKAPREVTLRTRTAPGQRVSANTMLLVVVDPTDPNAHLPCQRRGRQTSHHHRLQTGKKAHAGATQTPPPLPPAHPHRLHAPTRQTPLAPHQRANGPTQTSLGRRPRSQPAR